MRKRNQMVKDLKLAGHAKGTCDAYLNSIGDLAKFHWRAPEELSRDDIRAWVEYLNERRGLSSSRLGQYFAALRFFYGKTLGKPEMVSFLSLRSGPQCLPEVLTAEQVHQVLGGLNKPRYRVLFTTMYATGLRIRETCWLQTKDIDADRCRAAQQSWSCARAQTWAYSRA